MEEMKTSKLNSVIARFKALKKPYQIAIIAVVIIALILLIVTTSSKTPFDGLKDTPELNVVLRRYGKNPEVGGFYGTTLFYDPYRWLGYDGKLQIYMDDAGNIWRADGASWLYDSNNSSEVSAKIYKSLNRKFGKGEKEGAYIVWYDHSGNKYTLYSSGNDVIVSIS